MSIDREQVLADLKAFLRTIQKPNRPVDSLEPEDGLVTSGLIDSLAIIQIVGYLETKYGVDFAARGLDPERLSSMAGIVDLVAETKA